MTPAEHSGPPIERCWFCNGRILRDDSTRIVPGMGLKVHARCYELDAYPPPPTAA
jgi:hypothetical protein